MATAANPIGPIPAGVETGPIPVPGIAELFAALVAGAGADGEQGSGDRPAPEVAPEEIAVAVETLDDAATLLPMLDRQRAAAPAAKLIELPVDVPAPVQVGVAPAASAGTIDANPVQAAVPKGVQQPVEADQTAIGSSGQVPVEPRLAGPNPGARTVDGKPPANLAEGKARVAQSMLIDGKGPAAQLAVPAHGSTVPSPIAVADRAAASERSVAALQAQAPRTPPTGTVAASKQPATAALAQIVKAEVQAVTATPRPIEARVPEAAQGAGSRPAVASVREAVQGAGTRPAVASVPEAVQEARSRPAVASMPAQVQALQAEAGSKVTPPMAVTPAHAESGPAGPDREGAPLAPPAQPFPAAAAIPQAKQALPVAPAKPGEAEAVAVAAVAVEARKTPAHAKTRAARYAIAPPSAEPKRDAAVASASTEARAPIQPFPAIQPLVPPAAAPMAAPPQPVATALAQQVLDLSSGDAWIDQIARDISQTAGKDGAMRFRLAPETLGELRVEITHSERGAHVRLAVTSEQAQQALAAAEPKLAAEARAQGVRIAETEISFTGGQSQGRELGRQAQEQAQTQNGQPARTPRGNAATPSFTDAAEPSRSRRADRYA